MNAQDQKFLDELKEIIYPRKRYRLTWIWKVRGQFQTYWKDYSRLVDALSQADELMSGPLPQGDYVGACPRVYGTSWELDCGQGIISARLPNGKIWQWLRWEHRL